MRPSEKKRKPAGRQLCGFSVFNLITVKEKS
nr:MAG TPA: hypothetical protein [Caudoviricetes sp.]DAN73732.1 MAG TPA: hypothetical protein [Caudoviricetes sp.]